MPIPKRRPVAANSGIAVQKPVVVLGDRHEPSLLPTPCFRPPSPSMDSRLETDDTRGRIAESSQLPWLKNLMVENRRGSTSQLPDKELGMSNGTRKESSSVSDLQAPASATTLSNTSFPASWFNTENAKSESAQRSHSIPDAIQQYDALVPVSTTQEAMEGSKSKSVSTLAENKADNDKSGLEVASDVVVTSSLSWSRGPFADSLHHRRKSVQAEAENQWLEGGSGSEVSGARNSVQTGRIHAENDIECTPEQWDAAAMHHYTLKRPAPSCMSGASTSMDGDSDSRKVMDEVLSNIPSEIGHTESELASTQDRDSLTDADLAIIDSWIPTQARHDWLHTFLTRTSTGMCPPCSSVCVCDWLNK